MQQFFSARWTSATAVALAFMVGFVSSAAAQTNIYLVVTNSGYTFDQTVTLPVFPATSRLFAHVHPVWTTDGWDRQGRVWIQGADGHQIDLVCFDTDFNQTAWTPPVDVTALRSLLKGPVEIRGVIWGYVNGNGQLGYGGWTMDFQIEEIVGGNQGAPSVWATNVLDGSTSWASWIRPYPTASSPITVTNTIPAGFNGVYLSYTAEGHAGGGWLEFHSMEHKVYVDGNLVLDVTPWMLEDLNTGDPANRCNWQPGLPSPPYVINVTSALNRPISGPHTVSFYVNTTNTYPTANANPTGSISGPDGEGVWSVGAFLSAVALPEGSAGVIAHYTFDNTLNDSGPNGLALTTGAGGANYAAGGKFGQALWCTHFVGGAGTGNYQYNSSSLFAFGTSDFAVAFWYQFDWQSGQDPFGIGGMVNKDSAATARSGWDVRLSGSTTVPVIAYEIKPATTGKTFAMTNPPANESSVWHHILLQRRGNNMESWFDGVLTNSTSGVGGYDCSAPGYAFAVGARGILTSGAYGSGGGYGLNGRIDELWVFNNALSQAQIAGLVAYNVISQSNTLALASSPVSPSVVGSSVTFTATVQTNGATAGNAANTVVFKDGATPLSTNAVSSGVAAFSTSALGLGSHTIWAEYSGDANYLASTNSLVQLVNSTSSPVTRALVAHYSFDNTLNDSGPNSLTLTTGSGSANYSPGKFGSALLCTNFPGGAGTGNYHYNSSPLFDFGAGDFAVAFWYQSDHTNGQSGNYPFYIGQMVTKDNHATANPGWGVRLTGTTTVPAVGYTIEPAGTGNTVDFTTNAPADDSTVWHHIVLQRTGDIMECWLDGVLIYSTNGVDNVDVSTPGYAFAVGARGVLSSGALASGGGYGLDGRIDELWVFERSLAGEEIAELRDNNVPPPPEPGPQLTVARDIGAGSLVFTWPSQAGMRYNLLSNTGLSNAPATWPPYDNGVAPVCENIVADPSGTNTLRLALPPEAARFFALGEFTPHSPPIVTNEPWRRVVFDPVWAGDWVVAGDIDGDGEVELVSARNNGSAADHYVVSVIAYKLDGTVLWTWGNPSAGQAACSYDVACQVYDWNNDGHPEVVIATDIGGTRHIVELNGATGVEVRRFPIPMDSCDSIAFCNLTGGPGAYPRDITVKTRYTQIWAYDHNGSQLWTAYMPGGYQTSHQARPMDIDNDGIDEISAGCVMLNADGSQRWIVHDGATVYGAHVDCVRLFKQGATAAETRIVISFDSNDRLAMVDGNGNVVWQLTEYHYQSIDVAKMRDDIPGRQLAVDDGSYVLPIHIFDENGNLLEVLPNPAGYSQRIHFTIDWFGNGLESVVIAHPSRMYDGWGAERVYFDNGGVYPGLCMKGDMTGDGVPDVMMTIDHGVCIYKNLLGAPLPAGVPMGTSVNFTLY